MSRFFSGLTLLLAFSARPAAALENGLALTPPMGWNSWNKLRCNVSDGRIRKVAESLIATGMRDAGYVYVTIDDCWQGERDARGMILPDKTRFPQGMESLADFLHDKGLKLGIYSAAGPKTCEKLPGSRGFEERDAEQYANWGVDYLKYDWCTSEGLEPEVAYTKMRDALRKTQRPMVFGISEAGMSRPWTWAPAVGNLWRTAGDIGPCWEKASCAAAWEMGVMNALDLEVGLEAFAGPGHFNDPGVLEVGNGLSDVEDRSHFSLWALLAAPLFASNELATMSAMTKETLTNREVIAVNQDPLGVQGDKLRDDGTEEVWLKPLSGGAKAVVLLNRGPDRVRIKLRFSELGWPAGYASVRNLWLKQDAGVFSEGYSAEVAAHGVVMLRVARATRADFQRANKPSSGR